MKLAYVGAPGRALFPLTRDFAAHSNNAHVGLGGGEAVVYHDVRALPPGAPYYVCDAAVRSELCAPILLEGEVIGIVDAEAFAPNAFLAPAALAAVLGACAQLGELGLLRRAY